MSKKKPGDQQDELEQVPKTTEPPTTNDGGQAGQPDPKQPPEKPHHRAHPAPTVGRIVHYWKRVPQNNGVMNLEPLPALISGLNPPGNFQKGDWAVAMWIFPNKPGAAPEAKHGVLYSETPVEGRWSYVVIK